MNNKHRMVILLVPTINNEYENSVDYIRAPHNGSSLREQCSIASATQSCVITYFGPGAQAGYAAGYGRYRRKQDTGRPIADQLRIFQFLSTVQKCSRCVYVSLAAGHGPLHCWNRLNESCNSTIYF